jgi:outer membrane usher protein FimD/PapC
VPVLTAFQENQLLLDFRDFSLDYNFGELSKSLYPPYRSGQYWQVDVFKSQTFGGKLRARVNGQLVVVAPGSGSLRIEGALVPFLIGNDGDFFLDRIKPGGYEGEIVIDSRRCNFKLTIPVAKESYVKLGEVVACE